MIPGMHAVVAEFPVFHGQTASRWGYFARKVA